MTPFTFPHPSLLLPRENRAALHFTLLNRILPHTGTTPPFIDMAHPNRKSSPWIRWCSRILLLLALYALLGFVVIPWLAPKIVLPRLSRELSRPVTLEKLELNPFSLTATLTGLRMGDLDGETLLSWDRVHADLEASSLMGKTWVFRELTVTNPYVRVQLNKDLSLNVSDLIQHFSTTPTNLSAAHTNRFHFDLRIDQIRIDGARLSATDLTPRKPFRRIIGPLDLDIREFHTAPGRNNPHTFTGVTDSGEQISWSGTFGLDPFRANGSLSISNITLSEFEPFYEELVQFKLRSGKAAVRADYQILQTTRQGAIDLSITNAHAGVVDVAISESSSEKPLLSLASAGVENASGQWSSRIFNLQKVYVRDPQVLILRSNDASFPALQLLQPAHPSAQAPGGILVLLKAATNVLGLFQQSTNLVRGSLQEFSLQNGTVRFTDLSTHTPAELEVDRIEVAGKNLSNIPQQGQPMEFQTSLRWNQQGSVQTQTKLELGPLRGETRLIAQDLHLEPINPYLDPYLNLFIRRSKINLDGTVQVDTKEGNLPLVSFAGDTRLAQFTTAEGSTTNDLISWDSLALSGMQASLNPPLLTVNKVLLEGARARLSLLTNGQINVLTLIKNQPTNSLALLPANTSSPTSSSSTTPTGPLSLFKQAFAQIKTMLGTNTLTLQSTLPKLKVQTIAITNLQLDLKDESIIPNAEFGIKSTSGQLENLSTEDVRNAEISLTGSFVPLGTFNIAGQLNPLHQFKNTDLTLQIQGVDLLPGDPYASKFLGYKLTRGKASVDVHYTINERQLKGQNKISLNHFTLGTKFPSTNAIKLPIKTGIALLTDRDGRIDLDVPIEGNLDDPEFKLSRVIWHVIGNIFTKAITAPFALLGKLFGGNKGEDIQFQDFEAGTTTLSKDSTEKLNSIVKALTEKPGLSIETEGHASATEDLQAIRTSELLSIIRRRWEATNNASAKAAPQPATKPETSSPLTPEQRTQALRWLYTEWTSTNSANTPTTENATDSSPVAPTGQPDVGTMEKMLIAQIPISTNTLPNLAKARAIQVQTYLVETGKIAPDRVFLSPLHTTSHSFGTNGARVYLQIR